MKKVLVVLIILIISITTYLFWYVIAGLKYIPPHYHANFALYINNERIDFSWDEYMEDIAGCSLTWKKYPKDRVHLHENNPDTIHVHSEWAAWGHFFANNAWYFDDSRILSNTDVEYVTLQDNRIRFVLNGMFVENPYNSLIHSEDRLFIYYWTLSDEEILKLSESTVSKNAPEYNAKYDPGSCGWNNENAIIIILQDFLRSFMHSEMHTQ